MATATATEMPPRGRPRWVLVSSLCLLVACSRCDDTQDDAGSTGKGTPDATDGDHGDDTSAETGDATGPEAGEDTGDETLIVPEGLVVTALPGGNGVLEVTALTLRKGPQRTEVYAALENTGDIAACSAAFSIELFDRNEQSVAAGIGGLLTQRFYRLTDGSNMTAACVGPGDVTMAAVTDLPSALEVEDVGTVVYRCPYFALDVVPIEGLEVGPVTRVAGDGGTTFSGTLHNGLDVAVKNPSVTVFPLNRAGRPLDMTIAQGDGEVAPGGSWDFTTTPVGEAGVGQAAYPAARIEDAM